MKIKAGILLKEIKPAMGTLMSKKMKVKTSFKLAKLAKTLNEIIIPIEETQKKLILDNGGKTQANGNIIIDEVFETGRMIETGKIITDKDGKETKEEIKEKIPNPAMSIAKKQISELFDEDIEIDGIEKINISDEDITIEPALLLVLEDFIVFE